jgi:2-hydroxychromene-2-carboxylate isomerase
MSSDTQQHRAVANALWGALRRNRWRTHTVTRDFSKSNPSGYQAGPRLGTIATAPSASAVIEVHRECFITAILYAEDWPGATSHALRLNRDNYDTTIAHATHDNLNTANDWYHALTSATCRAPFHTQANRHGVPRLRRNGMDPLITTAVARTLEAIAAVTQVHPITEAQLDDYLITDDDIDLDAVQAALALTETKGLV